MHKKLILILILTGGSVLNTNIKAQKFSPFQIHKLLGLMPGILPCSNKLVSNNQLTENDVDKQTVARKYYSIYNSSLDSISVVLKNCINKNQAVRFDAPYTSTQKAINYLLDEVGGYDKLKLALDHANDIEQQNFVKNYMISRGFLPVILSFQNEVNSNDEFETAPKQLNALDLKKYMDLLERLRSQYLPEIDKALESNFLITEKYEQYKNKLMKLSTEVDKMVSYHSKKYFDLELKNALLITDLAFIHSYKELVQIAEKLEWQF